VSHVLLLEVAVCNTVAALVRHRIELQAVRELHLIGLAKLLERLLSLLIPPALLLSCSPAPRAVPVPQMWPVIRAQRLGESQRSRMEKRSPAWWR
jgi:hypothetical protein